MKFEMGTWQVTRDRYRSDTHTKWKNYRIVQGDGYSEAYARYVAACWDAHRAKAEPMPVQS